jgi:hypothetical protein
MKFYLVGFLPDCSKPNEWGMIGIYSDRAKAEAECRDCRYSVSIVRLNKTYSHLGPDDCFESWCPNRSVPGI